MVRATQRELRAIELDDPDVVLADAGYRHQRQIEAVVSDGIQVLVPPDAGLRKGARPGWTGGLYDFMRRVLATPDRRALYRQRQITIEPVSARSSSTPRSDASNAEAGRLQKRMAVHRRAVRQPPRAARQPARPSQPVVLA
jgi:type IV secretory pathway protease TraF